MNTEIRRRLVAPLVRGLVICFLVTSGLASAVSITEKESNDSFLSPQPIYVPAEGISVTAVIGQVGGTDNLDVDFFTFHGTQGDTPSIATVGALNPDAPESCLGFVANLVLYDATGKLLASASGDCFEGTEALINGTTLPATGTYIVGVSSWFHYFSEGGVVDLNYRMPGGAYLLAMSGVNDPSPPPSEEQPPTPPVTLPPPPAGKLVAIEIKRWNQDESDLGKRNGKDPITVVIFSMGESPKKKFSATTVDVNSLRFGSTGREPSLFRCRKEMKDRNHDGIPDLVCYFKPDVAGFKPDDLMGKLTGKMATGEPIYGEAALKIFTRKAEKRGFKHGPKK